MSKSRSSRLSTSMRIYEDLTLKEIGKTLNLTEGRISQIPRDALTKLRKRPKNSSTTLGNWQEAFS